ncbi:hypothetical protein HRR83_005881 [Exophiala dermatitidis]|uniref:Uncharacterized protein n=1 Tax=Exophiala dermatitidis TaxID=5970 RepID=A0AAN6EN21_EXODE|nr:hypothetical protein HRR73_007457 [Exophiala dermatitidis]KAJ4513436.1 hypothetical protein HRR74_006250 [Exophiala dermatitidis]KAJ4538009.1 hypothetical protein HRR77_007051 [Exophiala dermatitidis]KAJ4539740.1 hypothetical protein HRR76_003178 [Exophiala dermatitidis]KAJ4568093.1 hypothetical protein HRR81_007007 [Exophiala dermatitidis]
MTLTDRRRAHFRLRPPGVHHRTLTPITVARSTTLFRPSSRPSHPPPANSQFGHQKDRPAGLGELSLRRKTRGSPSLPSHCTARRTSSGLRPPCMVEGNDLFLMRS